jgi:nitroreductase
VNCIDAIMTRRSIRRYTTEPVSDADIETILRAAMAAPSAGNQQVWRFVVVRDPEVRMRLSEVSQFSGMLAEAPVGIVVCADTREERKIGYWPQDCSAAIENALLAAHSMGLGAVWLGVHPVAERTASVAEIVGLPEGVAPLSILSIGHPAEERPPAGRFKEAFVHYDRW